MSRYGNYTQPDPRYFDVGNAFLGGMQQTQDNNRRNALVDIEQQQFGLQQRRQGMMEDQYARELAGQQAAGQQAQSEQAALASLLESEGLPAEWANLPRDQLADMLERHEESKTPEQPKLIADHTGVLVPEAPGVRPFREPKTPPGPGTLYQVVGPDGKPRFVTAEEARGQQPFVKTDDDKSATASTALSAWEQGIGALETAMSNTVTGPIAGRSPALTDDQQVADASVAALAPLLKQIFRAAGEGVFTNYDQQLLLGMIPDRKINAGARASIIANIDSIVRAKLGQGPAQPAGADNDPLGIR
jgi:hypothetical protein